MDLTRFAFFFEFFAEVFTSDARFFDGYQFPLRHINVPLLESDHELSFPLMSLGRGPHFVLEDNVIALRVL
jgi:hypothetical protein